MAARIRKLEIDTEWRKRIQTGVILKRLEDHVVGKQELTATQISAANILLRKSIPDLSATELTGAEGGPLQLIAKWQSEKS
jgi:hypothetical protein